MRIRPLIVGWALAALPLSAFAQTGAISGTVNRSDTSAALSGVTVRATNGDEAASGFTNASGAYTISGLAPGTYYVMTNAPTGFVDEIYNNIQCFGSCVDSTAIATGTPIVVTAGATASNRNFSLALGGRVRGTITDQQTALPLANITVNIRHGFSSVDSVTTNASGQFTGNAVLATGTYHAYTDNVAGYLNEIYDNISCGINCQLLPIQLIATPIPVTEAIETAGVNFALRKGATVSGTVTAAGTGLPLEGINVAILNASAAVQAQAFTNASGNYQVIGLPAGTYYAVTNNGLGYINELYSDIPCVGTCDSVVGGTPIVVDDGGAATGRNFALTPGGRISGTVLAAATSEPVSAALFVYSSVARLVDQLTTDSSGAYQTGVGLPSGDYYVATQNFDRYINEIYDDIECNGQCDAIDTVTRGTPIAVTNGVTTTGRNFRLRLGGSITGRVTDATGAALEDIHIVAWGPGEDVNSANTDANGDYEIEGLPPGPYVVYTATDQGHVNEIYDNIPCVYFCDESTARQLGTKVSVSADTTAPGINFALVQGGTMSGRVTNASNGAGLADVSMYVARANIRTLAPVLTVATDANGAYAVPGLSAGEYHVYTENELGFIDEALGNLPCLGGCPGAAVLGGTMTVLAGLPATGVNFALDPGARIAGTVTAAGSSTPADATITIVDAGGRVVQRAFTGSGGAYLTPSGLAPGSYFAFAVADEHYASQVYGGASCATTCTPAAAVALGVPIVVGAGATVSGRNFALDGAGHITGTVIDAVTGIPVARESLEIYDSDGRLAALGEIDNQGIYETFPGLPPGSYYALTTSSTHVNEIYNDIPCPAGCAPSRAPTGTPIVVSAGATTAGRNFALAPRSGAPGPPILLTFNVHPQGVLIAWQAPTTGGVAASYRLEAGLTPGTTAVSFAVNEPQFLAIGAPAGQYFVRVRGINASGTGVPMPDSVLIIGAGGLLPGAPRQVRAWLLDSRLIMTWEQPGSGGVPTQYLVEAGTASGLANIATIPATRLGFSYFGVPPGFYFLRVRAANATGVSAPSNEVMLVMSTPATPPRPPYEVGATVTGSTVKLTWSAPAGATTGYVLEAGSAPGLSNLAVLTIGPSTTISFPGIAPGTYYVRLRAINSTGRSGVSDEVVIVVS